MFARIFGAAVLAGLAGTAGAQDLRLVEASKKQDAEAVRQLLRQKADIKAKQVDGTTALHWAAYRDNLTMVNLLVDAGAPVNAATDLGITPLFLASSNGSGSVVNRLMRAGANPNVRLPTGESPLMAAARAGNSTALKALLAGGAQVNVAESEQKQTALMWAVAAQQLDVARLLVEAGADIHARTKVTPRLVYTGYRYITAPPAQSSGTVVEVPEGGFTALLFAAQQGNVDSLRLLLDAGANVNDTAPIGTSALVVAAHSGHREAVSLLLDRGANPNTDGAGYTALHAAVLIGDVAIARLLVSRGADLNARITKGTPVRKYGQEYVLTANWKGATPFWLAARFAEPAILQILAAAGADPRLVPDDGTPSLVAAIPPRTSQGDRRERYMTDSEAAAVPPDEDERLTLESIQAILTTGVDINTTDRAGETILHLAAGKLYNRVIQYLADKGANLSVANKRGLTPLASLVARAKAPLPDLQLGPPPPSGTETIALLQKLGAK